jgi:uncharacterized membrane protein YqaE (UPF0057 family)
MADTNNYKSTKIAIVISIFFVLSYIPAIGEGLLKGIYGETFLQNILKTDKKYLYNIRSHKHSLNNGIQ